MSTSAFKAGDHLGVLPKRETDDVYQDPGLLEVDCQPRQFDVTHTLHTRIGEADGIQHPAPEFGDPWGRVSVARQQRDGLGHQAAHAVEGHHPVEFSAESGRA